MKVLQVVASISEECSGPSYSVPGLCAGLKMNGVDVSLVFGGRMPNRHFDFQVKSYPVWHFPHPRLGFSPALKCGMTNSAVGADIVHNNGLWMFANIYSAYAARVNKAKFVVAPRGCLAPWCLQHHKLQKRIFGAFAQYRAMAQASMFHATSEKEYEEIRAAGHEQPVAIVPIGMDCVCSPALVREKLLRLESRQHSILFFGRIHKVKGLIRLLKAWAQLHTALPDWDVKIAGPDGGALAEALEYVRARHLPRVRYVGALHGQEKYRFLTSGDLYVLPTETENFGVTIAEALSVGTPVVTTTGTCWSGLNGSRQFARSGWWVENSVDAIVAAIREATDMSPGELQRLGENGKIWVRRQFAWQRIGAQMRLAYEWLLRPDDVARPDFIIL